MNNINSLDNNEIKQATCEHDFRVLKSTWQTVDYTRYQVLNHSKEILLCSKCGMTMKPLEEFGRK